MLVVIKNVSQKNIRAQLYRILKHQLKYRILKHQLKLKLKLPVLDI